MGNTKRASRVNFTRTFIQGHIEHVLLSQLRAAANHGYGLIENIRREFHIYLGPSTIYPSLHWLEKMGFVESEWDTANPRPRRMFTITLKGKESVRDQDREIREILSKMVAPIC